MKSPHSTLFAFTCAALLAFFLPITATQAQNTFVVDSLDDQYDFFPGNGVCLTVQGVCTLRAAIQEANELPNGASPDVIVFDDIPVTSGIAQIDIIFGLLPNINETVIIDAENAPGEVRINGEGLYVNSVATGTTIKGLTIGNFTNSGIYINADDTVIENNYIGVTPSGENFGCGNTGISIFFAENNRIGGVGKGNVIGFCEYYGIDIWSSEGTLIRGNYIGATPSGQEAPVPYAIDLYGSPNTIIGGPTRAFGNVIGFAVRGITTSAAQDGLRIRNNYIGTNEEGSDLGNETGITALGSNATIGGRQEYGNVIGYNDVGIDLLAYSNKIKGNYIGTNEAGDDLGNRKGIVVEGGADNIIGYALDASIPLVAEKANIIAYNEEEGIAFETGLFFDDALEITIRGNQIYDNGAAGIDLLGAVGLDPNDADDSDIGPNNLLNYPDVERVDYNGSFDAIGIEYSISSDPAIVSYPLTVDFYIADNPISGEGKTYIGTDTYSTQNNIQLFDIDATSITWASTDVLVLTTTDADGNTSEFSPASTEIGGPGNTVSGMFDDERPELVPRKEKAGELPNSIVLSGNYPNPFNSQTTIAYELPQTMEVTLTVYDQMGRLIRELVNSNQPAGSYHVSFDASALPSGAYYYRVQTDELEKTGKMLLIR